MAFDPSKLKGAKTISPPTPAGSKPKGATSSGILSRAAEKPESNWLTKTAVGAGKGLLRGLGRFTNFGEEILSFGKVDDTLGKQMTESKNLKGDGAIEKVAGAIVETPFAATTGFVKESLKRIAEASATGEKILSFGKAKDTQGQRLAQSEELKLNGVGEHFGGMAQRFVEAFTIGKAIGAPASMGSAFGQGASLTSGQLVLNDVGQNDKGLTESFVDSIPTAVVSGGIGAGLFGVLRWFSGSERGLAEAFNKELQPPTADMGKQFARGFATVGDDVAGVVDDAGNPVYTGKSYSSLVSTAKKEIEKKSLEAKSLLATMDETSPAALGRDDIVSDTINHFDNLYSGELTTAQENTIVRELKRIPGKMTRVEAQEARQGVDDLLKDSDFTLKEGQKAFVTEVRLLLRNLLNKKLVASATDDDIGKVYTALNKDVSIGYDVRDLSGIQKAIIEKAKISGKGGFWAAAGNFFDNVLFPPQVSTKIPGALKAASEAAPSMIAPLGSGVDGLLPE